jgi:hypothetical protein
MKLLFAEITITDNDEPYCQQVSPSKSVPSPKVCATMPHNLSPALTFSLGNDILIHDVIHHQSTFFHFFS